MAKPWIRIIVAALVWQVSPASALSLNGVTAFGRTLEINARVAGLVSEVPVHEGQRVAAGTLLMALDKTPHQSRLEHAQAVESGLKPGMINMQLELDRAQELYDRDSLSQVELQLAENRFAEAESAFDAARAETRLAAYELELAEVHAPFAGRLLAVRAQPGQYLDPAVDARPVLTLVETGSMLAVAVLTSEQWDPSLLKKPAMVKYRGRNYPATVEFVGLQRVEKSGGLPAFEIRARFNTEQLIPAQMPVSIEIAE